MGVLMERVRFRSEERDVRQFVQCNRVCRRCPPDLEPAGVDVLPEDFRCTVPVEIAERVGLEVRDFDLDVPARGIAQHGDPAILPGETPAAAHLQPSVPVHVGHGSPGAGHHSVAVAENVVVGVCGVLTVRRDQGHVRVHGDVDHNQFQRAVSERVEQPCIAVVAHGLLRVRGPQPASILHGVPGNTTVFDEDHVVVAPTAHVAHNGMARIAELTVALNGPGCSSTVRALLEREQVAERFALDPCRDLEAAALEIELADFDLGRREEEAASERVVPEQVTCLDVKDRKAVPVRDGHDTQPAVACQVAHVEDHGIDHRTLPEQAAAVLGHVEAADGGPRVPAVAREDPGQLRLALEASGGDEARSSD